MNHLEEIELRLKLFDWLRKRLRDDLIFLKNVELGDDFEERKKVSSLILSIRECVGGES